MMKNKVWKRWIIRIVFLGMLLGIITFVTILIINFYVKSTVEDRIITPEEAKEQKDVDCILILGAGVWANNSPSPMLEDRLKQGIDLYDTGVSSRLLMSGDHGRKDYDEVNVMKQYAVKDGIDASDIFMDHAGFSTYESLYRAKEIFEADKVIIVTQKYHMYRALYVAKCLGIDAYGVTADLGQYGGQSYRELRETAARLKDFLFCITKPEPTYLGETIPVSGDGNQTNDN